MTSHELNEKINTEPSETAKYRHLTEPYCKGNGIDVGSGGYPVVSSAIQIELGDEAFLKYRSGQPSASPIQWRGDDKTITNLPFQEDVLDYVYSSHLIEDFVDWGPILHEWTAVLKPSGHLVILVPDKMLWNDAIRRGQPPNCAHRHESYVGELSEHVTRLRLPLKIVRDSLTNCMPGDYSILFVAQKVTQ